MIAVFHVRYLTQRKPRRPDSPADNRDLDDNTIAYRDHGPQTCSGRQMQSIEELVLRHHPVHALGPKAGPLKFLKLRAAQQVSFCSLAHCDSVDGSQISSCSFCRSGDSIGDPKCHTYYGNQSSERLRRTFSFSLRQITAFERRTCFIDELANSCV